WTPPQPAETPPAEAKAAPPKAVAAKGTKSARLKATGKGPAQAAKAEAPAAEEAGGSTLRLIQEKAQAATRDSKEYLENAGSNLKDYADSHLDELKEISEPVTKHLPEPVQNFLDGNGWWWVLGALGLVALLWLRSIVRRMIGARPKPRKGKKKKAK